MNYFFSGYFQCGKRPSVNSRVIGGANASPNSWPWQVVILTNGQPGCGGSIISPDYIVTAAHCVVDGNDRIKSARSFSIK